MLLIHSVLEGCYNLKMPEVTFQSEFSLFVIQI